MDALSRDERLPVFYKRDVTIACEPLTRGSKTVYANLYRVSYFAERFRSWVQPHVGNLVRPGQAEERRRVRDGEEI